MKKVILTKILKAVQPNLDTLHHSHRSNHTLSPELITQSPSLDYVLMSFPELLWENIASRQLYQNHKYTCHKSVRALSSMSFLVICIVRNVSEEGAKRTHGSERNWFSVSCLLKICAHNRLSFHFGCQKIRVQFLKLQYNHYV